MNRYEKKIYQTLATNRIVFACLFFTNLVVPVLNPYSMGYTLILQWLIVLVHGWGMLNSTSYFSQKIPMFSIFLLRGIQVAKYAYFHSVNWKMLIGLWLLDIFYLIFLLRFKNNYEFERIPKEMVDNGNDQDD